MMGIMTTTKEVVPARAGVILAAERPLEVLRRCSRASGGDPGLKKLKRPIWKLFPRERG